MVDKKKFLAVVEDLSQNTTTIQPPLIFAVPDSLLTPPRTLTASASSDSTKLWIQEKEVQSSILPYPNFWSATFFPVIPSTYTCPTQGIYPVPIHSLYPTTPSLSSATQSSYYSTPNNTPTLLKTPDSFVSRSVVDSKQISSCSGIESFDFQHSKHNDMTLTPQPKKRRRGNYECSALLRVVKNGEQNKGNLDSPMIDCSSTLHLRGIDEPTREGEASIVKHTSVISIPSSYQSISLHSISSNGTINSNNKLNLLELPNSGKNQTVKNGGRPRKKLRHDSPGMSPTTCARRVANHLPEGIYEHPRAQYSSAKGEWRVRFTLNGERRERSFSTKLRGHSYAQSAANALLEMVEGRCVDKYSKSRRPPKRKEKHPTGTSNGSLSANDTSENASTELALDEGKTTNNSDVIRPHQRKKMQTRSQKSSFSNSLKRPDSSIAQRTERRNEEIVYNTESVNELISANHTYFSKQFEQSKSGRRDLRHKRHFSDTSLGIEQSSRANIHYNGQDAKDPKREEAKTKADIIACFTFLHTVLNYLRDRDRETIVSNESTSSPSSPSQRKQISEENEDRIDCKRSQFDPFNRRHEFFNEPPSDGYTRKPPVLECEEIRAIKKESFCFPTPSSETLVTFKTNTLSSSLLPSWVTNVEYFDYLGTKITKSAQCQGEIWDLSKETLRESFGATLLYSLEAKRYATITRDCLRKEGGWSEKRYPKTSKSITKARVRKS